MTLPLVDQGLKQLQGTDDAARRAIQSNDLCRNSWTPRKDSPLTGLLARGKMLSVPSDSPKRRWHALDVAGRTRSQQLSSEREGQTDA